MNEVFFCTGIIMLTIGVSLYVLGYYIIETKKIVVSKQDAIMAKLIEIKFR